VYAKFTRELYMLATMQHKSVVQVIGCTADTDSLTLVIEVRRADDACSLDPLSIMHLVFSAVAMYNKPVVLLLLVAILCHAPVSLTSHGCNPTAGNVPMFFVIYEACSV
jgi:hypothetical protein